MIAAGASFSPEAVIIARGATTGSQAADHRGATPESTAPAKQQKLHVFVGGVAGVEQFPWWHCPRTVDMLTGAVDALKRLLMNRQFMPCLRAVFFRQTSLVSCWCQFGHVGGLKRRSPARTARSHFRVAWSWRGLPRVYPSGRSTSA